MEINVVTIFPEMFDGPMKQSIWKRAAEKNVVDIRIHNLRDYTTDKHRVVDDYPYGGGAGMVMKPEPFSAAIDGIKGEDKEYLVVMTSPQGQVFNQKLAKELSKQKKIILLCGHYEGIDERVRVKLVDMEISIGDYVLTGGEFAAMVIIDAVVRLLPGAIGNKESFEEDSFYNGLLEHPHYTRPPEYLGMKVPDILLSGNHEKIRRWRLKESLRRTLERRPDLLEKREMTREEKELLKEVKRENIEKNCNSNKSMV
jgi:tRNA (guanine37-N1)-methyltransferase